MDLSIIDPNIVIELPILPAKRKKSAGLTILPAVAMRSMFLPYPDNFNFSGTRQVTYHNFRGHLCKIESHGLNSHTDFGTFCKLVTVVSEQEAITGQVIRIKFDEFMTKSVNVNFTDGKSSRQRLSHSIDRISAMSVLFSEDENETNKNQVKSWLKSIPFSNMAFDAQNDEVVFECNKGLHLWYKDSIRQLLVDQYNQLSKNYTKAVYLYLESIYKNNEPIEFFVETLRDNWWSSRFVQFKTDRQRKQSERNVNNKIISALDELDSIQYFEHISIETVRLKDSTKKTLVRFIKRERRKRHIALNIELNGSTEMSDEQMLLEGVVIKPKRSRLPKMPFSIDRADKVDELINWAVSQRVILIQYKHDLYSFDGSNLSSRDRKNLEKVENFLEVHIPGGLPAGKSIKNAVRSAKLKPSKTKVKHDRLLAELEAFKSEVCNTVRSFFQLDELDGGFDSKEVAQFLSFNKISAGKLSELKAEIEICEKEMTQK